MYSGDCRRAANIPAPQAEPRPAVRSTLSDQEAIEILDLGVKFLNNFLNLALETTARITPEEVRRVAVEEPEPVQANPQKRPRGAMHGIMLLFKLGIASANLLPRLLKVTHPGLFDDAGDGKRAARAAEKFKALVNKVMPQASPGTA
jgi:hypothetical protein